MGGSGFKSICGQKIYLPKEKNDCCGGILPVFMVVFLRLSFRAVT